MNTALPIQAVSRASTRKCSAYLRQTTCGAILSTAQAVLDAIREVPRIVRGISAK